MWLLKVVRSPGRDPGHDKELRNGPEVKIDILDEGYWSPKLFQGYRVTTSVTERSFGDPDVGVQTGRSRVGGTELCV